MPPKKTTPQKSTKAKKSIDSSSSAKKKPVVQESAPVVQESAPVVQETTATPTTPAPPNVVSSTISSTAVQTTVSSTDDSWSSIETRFSALNTQMVEWKTLYNSMQTELKVLHRDVTRHMKDVSKKHRRKRKVQEVDPNAPKRAPSGFAKPTLMSNELCAFLGEAPGTEMARTEVTKYLTTYIKENNLQNQANKRIILPDDKLTALLNVTPTDEVTYFNLQKYMKVHFPKQSKPAVVSA
jgi:chromatin remodeling complex protein RSC6